MIIDAAGDAIACTPSPTAICFTAKNASGIVIESCAPNQAACEKGNAGAFADTTNTDLTACASVSQ